MAGKALSTLAALTLVLGMLAAEAAFAGNNNNNNNNNNNTPNAWGVLRQLFIEDLDSAENDVNMDVRQFRRQERDLWRQFENDGFIDFDAYQAALGLLEDDFKTEEEEHRRRCNIQPRHCQPGGGGNSTDR